MSEPYFTISPEKETRDIATLIEQLRPFITPDTIIVNCSPDYSSLICQRVIHAYYDNPLPMLPFEMPYPGTSFEEAYPRYCRTFAERLSPHKHYVFIDSGVLRGRNFKTLGEALFAYAPGSVFFRFAALYVQDDAVFTPAIFVEKFNRAAQGMLLFWWENVNCTLFG